MEAVPFQINASIMTGVGGRHMSGIDQQGRYDVTGVESSQRGGTIFPWLFDLEARSERTIPTVIKIFRLSLVLSFVL